MPARSAASAAGLFRDVPRSLHHLIPKLCGGRGGPTVLLHQICHGEIHATLAESELARTGASLDALRAPPRRAQFVAWVSKRPPASRPKIPNGPRNGAEIPLWTRRDCGAILPQLDPRASRSGA